MMKRTLATVLALAMILALAACGGNTPSSSSPSSPSSTDTPKETPSSNELTIYTALPEEEGLTYIKAFEEETGITVNYIRLAGGEMMTRVVAEKDNPQASIMLGGSSDNHIAAGDQGVLEPYQAKDLDKVPEQFIDANGIYNPIYIGVISFACNADWFSEKGYSYPTSWADLLDPKYKGELIMGHPATSSVSYTAMATLMQMMGEDAGWDYINSLNANMSQYTKSGSAAPNAVALGEAAVAVTISHDGLQPTAEGYHIELSFPEDGTGFEVGAVSLIKNGPEKERENAERFIEWCCSTSMQNLYATNNSFRVPTNVDAVPADGLVTLDKVNCYDFDAAQAASEKAAFNEMFESSIATKPEN